MTKGLRNTIVIAALFAIVITAGVIVFATSDNKPRYPKNAIWVKEKGATKEVDGLHPKLRKSASDFFTDVEKLGYSVLITDANRSSQEQMQLDKINPSNADVGLSDHEYGLAFDINIKKNGKIVLKKANSRQDWINSGIVSLAKKHGFKWGGDFKNYHDPIHFYNDFGIPAPQMKQMKLAGKVDKQGYIKV